MVNLEFSSFNSTSPSLLADQLELYLWCSSSDDSLSQTDIASLINGMDVELDYGELEEVDEENVLEWGQETIIDEEVDTTITALFDTFDKRIKNFGELYPFYLQDDLLIKKEERVEFNIYIFLAACSNLSLLSRKSDESMFTAPFEDMVKLAMTFWFPNCDVKRFGAGCDDRRTYFSSNLRDALKKLAEFCSAEAKGVIDEKDAFGHYKLSSSRDAGLDVVGCYNFGDQRCGNFIIFGQCATGKGWEKKNYEPKTVFNYIDFSKEPLISVFIPYDWVDVDGKWLTYGALSDVLLIDRKRILGLFQKSDRGWIAEFPFPDFN